MNLTSCLLFSNIKCHCDASMMAYNYTEASGHSASAERFNQVDSIRAYFSAMAPFTITSACTDPSVVFSWLFSISVRLADFPWMILFRSTFFRVWFLSTGCCQACLHKKAYCDLWKIYFTSTLSASDKPLWFSVPQTLLISSLLSTK